MQIEIRGSGKYELELFGRAYVITRAQLDELHELIESVNVVEHQARESGAPKCKAIGCNRKTRADHGYCFQHSDFPKY